MDKKAIIQRALDNINHPLSEITRRMTYRARSPGVAPVSGIKMALPKTSTMAKKMQKVLDDETPEGRKKQKQMANLVIGREEDDKEILLQFKTAASREKFRKLMNEDVQIDEETQHIIHVKTDRAGYRKLEAMIASLDGYKESEFEKEGKATFTFDAKKHDAAERKKAAEFIKKTRGAEFSHAMKEGVQLDEAEEVIVNFRFDNRSDAIAFNNQAIKQGLALRAKEFKSQGKQTSQLAVDEDKLRSLYFNYGPKLKKLAKKYMGKYSTTDGDKNIDKMMREDMQLGEEVIKARVSFFGRPNKNNSDMRDAKKKNMFVDAKDVSAAKGKMFDVTFNSRRQFNRFESEYDFLMVKVFEDVQLDETNFRFPQPGEDYGELGMSINDPDSFSGSGPSRAELKKRSAEVDRKFASVMRKHKRTKVGEVLDLLDKDGGTKLYKDSDIKQISKYLTKHKDNVRKVAHEMLIIVMQGDDYLAKKRIPVREDVQLDETMTARDLESMIKGLKRGAKQEIADVLNDMDLSGYGDYEARVDNVHKFKTKDLFEAMKKVMRLESLKMSLDERAMTYVIDRRTKKIVFGPTDTGDAKLFLNKQVQPRKFMIRQIRGAAKKVGDIV